MLVLNPFTHDSRVEKEAVTLAAAGYRVTVVAAGGAGLAFDEERDGYRIRRVPRGPARLPGLRLVQYRRRLREALRQTEPMILHSHDADALGPAAVVAHELGIPFVHDAHELWTDQVNRGRSPLYFALFRAYYRMLEARLLPQAAGVVTVSAPIARELLRRYRLRVPVELVPNYPEVKAAPRPRPLRDLFPDLPLPTGMPILLYLGGIQAGRGIEQLLEALRAVPQAAAVFLGGGPPLPAVVDRARALGIYERLRFLPPVPSTQVVDFAASAHLGVSLALPVTLNNRYSLPNKLFQYMAAGLPVVASDFEQIREIVVGSRVGLVVDPSDPSAIATAIRHLLDHPAEARAMGKRGQRAIAERYRWAASAATLLALYRRISPADG